MANIQDTSVQISIAVIGEGNADVTSLIANPQQVYPGGSSTITAAITNTGSSDTIYADFYVNGTLFSSKQTSAPITGQWLPSPSITISNILATATVLVRAGHIVFGGAKDEDDTMTVAITLYPQGAAAFSAGPTFPSSVEQGADANIIYTVVNNGGADRLWGGLYDETDTLVAGTYWQQDNVVSGGTVGPLTITITNIQTSISGWSLKIGHYVEE